MRQEERALHEEQLRDLAEQFDARPSKREDVGQIEQLKWAMTRKEEEVRRLSRDLKHCNLEL